MSLEEYCPIGSKEVNYVIKCSSNATKIQKVFRGWRGRKEASLSRVELENQLRSQFFNRCAASIQKVWKGHKTRLKYNFYERKLFLLQIQQQNISLRLHGQELADKEWQIHKVPIPVVQFAGVFLCLFRRCMSGKLNRSSKPRLRSCTTC